MRCTFETKVTKGSVVHGMGYVFWDLSEPKEHLASATGKASGCNAERETFSVLDVEMRSWTWKDRGQLRTMCGYGQRRLTFQRVRC